MRVLLIDDDEMMTKTLGALLTKGARGPVAFEVRHAAGLFEAMQILDEPGEPFDAVLLDLGLPECGGLTTVKAVRGHSPAAPIVVISGLDAPGIAAEAAQAGADDYLVKGRFDAARLELALIVAGSRRATRPVEVSSPELRGTFRLDAPDGPARDHLARSVAAG